jgi:hypothetical protein
MSGSSRSTAVWACPSAVARLVKSARFIEHILCFDLIRADLGPGLCPRPDIAWACPRTRRSAQF